MKNIIWLASYPKSGNTWLRFFLYSYFHGIPRKSGDINEKIPDIHANAQLEARTSAQVFCKTHFIYSPRHPFLQRSAGYIYLIRHPKDVLLSNLNYFRLTGHQKLDPQRFAEEFIQHQGVPFWRKANMGTWVEHVESWAEDREDPSLILHYEALRKDPATQFARVLDFLGEDIHRKTFELALQRSSFDNMRRIENKEKQKKEFSAVFWGNPDTARQGLRFLHKGGTNQRLDKIHPDLDQRFDEAFAEPLEKLGYC